MIKHMGWKIRHFFNRKLKRNCVHCGEPIHSENLSILKMYNIDFELLPDEISGSTTDYVIDLCNVCYGKFYRDYEELLYKYQPDNVKGSKSAQKIIKNPIKYIKEWYTLFNKS